MMFYFDPSVKPVISGVYLTQVNDSFCERNLYNYYNSVSESWGLASDTIEEAINDKHIKSSFQNLYWRYIDSYDYTPSSNT